jgi:hypothetical protein
VCYGNCAANTRQVPLGGWVRARFFFRIFPAFSAVFHKQLLSSTGFAQPGNDFLLLIFAQ